MRHSTALTKPQQRAAQLVAEDVRTDEQIAAELRIGRATLARWKDMPAFAARVSDIVTAYSERLVRKGVAERQNRVDALNDRWQRMARVIDERGADPALQDVPGGQTGLLVHQVKQIGAGKNAQIVDEYAVDTGLLREMRAHEQQAAQELGQWADKSEQRITSDQVITIRFDRADDTDLSPPLALPSPGTGDLLP